MNTIDVGDEFQTKAGCFQTTADELQAKLNLATLALKQTGMEIPGRLAATCSRPRYLLASPAECALKALSVKSTGKYRRDRRGHDLSKLYDDLTLDVQELVDSIAEARGVASPKTILEEHFGDVGD